MLKRFLIFASLALLLWAFSRSSDFTQIAAGVAIFLFGMIALEEGFQTFTGGALERVLRASTDRLWKAMLFGLVTTSIVQSSSLVSVLSITFLSAGLIDLAAGIGIIFGSNIGTTTGAWLIAGVGLKVDIAAYALPMLVFGVVLNMQSDRMLQGFGYVLAGVGFVFLGISYMKTGFDGLQSTIDLSEFSMTGLTGVLVYTLVGIAMTVIMQSSHAALIIGITALAAGQVTYENSLAIAIGSNVGTTVTALIGAMKASIAGKRLALAHLFFNLAVGALAIILLPQLRDAVDWISAMIGIAAEDYTLKFAVFHTLFNVLGVLIMTPLIQPLIALLLYLVPDKIPDISKPIYLNDAALALPDTAMEALEKEFVHLYDNVIDLMALGLGLSGDKIRSKTSVAELVAEPLSTKEVDLQDIYERRVKSLHGAFTEFAVRAEPALLPEQSKELQLVRRVARDLVTATKDIKHINRNMRRYSVSRNKDIAQQYRSFKSLILRVLLELEALRKGEVSEREVFEQIRADMEASDVVTNGELDRLIRENRITPEMGTSVINDSQYVRSICEKLTDTALVIIEHRSELPDMDDWPINAI